MTSWKFEICAVKRKLLTKYGCFWLYPDRDVVTAKRVRLNFPASVCWEPTYATRVSVSLPWLSLKWITPHDWSKTVSADGILAADWSMLELSTQYRAAVFLITESFQRKAPNPARTRYKQIEPPKNSFLRIEKNRKRHSDCTARSLLILTGELRSTADQDGLRSDFEA